MVALRDQPMPHCRCRPSVLDPLRHGDSWVAQCTDGLVLYHNNLPVAMLAGSGLERATFNTLLFQLQYRPPRSV